MSTYVEIPAVHEDSSDVDSDDSIDESIAKDWYERELLERCMFAWQEILPW